MDYKVNLIITHFMMTRDDPKYQSCSLLSTVKKKGGVNPMLKKLQNLKWPNKCPRKGLFWLKGFLEFCD